jgi:hypothetical protein
MTAGPDCAPQQFHVDLVEWCRQQRADALKNIEIIDRGDFRLGAGGQGPVLKDHTAALRATYERIFEQMGHLLKTYGESDAYDP